MTTGEMLEQSGNNRLRLFRLSLSDAVCLLNIWRQSPEYIAVPEFPQSLPPGAKIVSLHSDLAYRALVMTVHHESFDAVPDGEQIPMNESCATLVVRRVKLDPPAKNGE